MGFGRSVCEAPHRAILRCVISMVDSHLHVYMDQLGRLRLPDAERKLVNFDQLTVKRYSFFVLCWSAAPFTIHYSQITCFRRQWHLAIPSIMTAACSGTRLEALEA